MELGRKAKKPTVCLKLPSNLLRPRPRPGQAARRERQKDRSGACLLPARCLRPQVPAQSSAFPAPAPPELPFYQKQNRKLRREAKTGVCRGRRGGERGRGILRTAGALLRGWCCAGSWQRRGGDGGKHPEVRACVGKGFPKARKRGKELASPASWRHGAPVVPDVSRALVLSEGERPTREKGCV